MVSCNEHSIPKFNVSVSVPPSCEDADKNLVVPVTYTIGGDAVNNRTPPGLSDGVVTGFMQFRAKSLSGDHYAFCPAVK